MESIGIAEVAALAGVSPATVSRALRGIPGVAAATRVSVRAAAEQLGYVASPSAAIRPELQLTPTGIAEVAALAEVSPATVSRALRGFPGVSATTRLTVRAAAQQLGYVAGPTGNSRPEPQAKSAGIAEVAALAEVSPATVSRALRGIPGVAEATRLSVRAAAEQLGYVASPSAASLSTGRAGAIGVISPWFSRWFFATAVEGVQSEVLSQSYDLLLYSATLGVSAEVHRVNMRSIHKRVDGVIAVNVPISPEQFGDFPVPVVTLGSHYPGISAVTVDDTRVGTMAVDHLLSLGHRTIAFLGQDPDRTFGFTAAADRLTGYRRSLTRAGIDIDDRLIDTTGFSNEGGAEGFRRLWSAVESGRVPRPTAIFAVCDEVAMGIIHQAAARGVRVPEDLSVVGVDDHDLAYLFGLTTIRQPVREQGAIASRLLLEHIWDPWIPARHECVEPRLIVRRSTARRPPGT